MKSNLVNDNDINGVKKRIPLPTSIPYDPIKASKYKTKRDFFYNEDPVYRKAVRERYFKSYYKNKKEDKYVYKVTCDQCDQLVFTCEKMILEDENNEPFVLCQKCKDKNTT